MATIMVTGGAGFIGSHVCDALLAQGDKILCVDNFNDYYDPQVKEKNIVSAQQDKNFKLFRVDITDFASLQKIFSQHKVDKIVHLAARAGVRPSLKDPLLYDKVNVQGTLHLLELAKKHKVKQFIFGSSSSVYGERKKVPFAETDSVERPISPYAATKRAGELLCYTYSNLYQLPVTCLRFFTVYGPRGRPDMAVYKFTDLISSGKNITMYGGGKTKRDYTYVTDIVSGVLGALTKELAFEIVNLGDSNPVELHTLIHIIEKYLKKTANIVIMKPQEGDVTMTFADISKAKSLFQYSPNIQIEEGIKSFIAWYVSNR